MSLPGPSSPPTLRPSTFAISIQVYGRGDATLGDGPSHMAIAIYEVGSPICELHHIRNPNDQDFIYDRRVQPLEDPVLRGRCELNTHLTAESKDRAVSLLTEFGDDKSHIPKMGMGNCQDWVADVVTMLERADIDLVPGGEGTFWREMINLGADQMKDRCIETGREWAERSARSDFEGVPDARFADEGDEVKKKVVGKLTQNPVFGDRMRALMGGNGNGQTRESFPSEDSTERPFYISSPFFSRTG